MYEYDIAGKSTDRTVIAHHLLRTNSVHFTIHLYHHGITSTRECPVYWIVIPPIYICTTCPTDHSSNPRDHRLNIARCGIVVVVQ